ncbi:MAG: rhodanese-like domain-containing protein [Fimbriimonas sp.]
MDITPTELAAELKGQSPPFLLDVREPHELEISVLPGVVAIPLGELPARYSALDKEADWVVICRVGGRSGKACEFLRAAGFARVRNLVTGMNGYAQTVDTSLPVY